MTATKGALAGLRVVEIAAGLAVAYCGQLLAQCGAEVVRIEPAEGDSIRRQGPFPGDAADIERGGMQRVLNGGKRSVAADVASTDGAELASQLIAESDLLLSSHQIEAALPLADPRAFAQRFPGVLYVSISPFGATGPYAGYRADSHVIEALAGFSYVTGNPDREPLSMGVELADYFAGINGFSAALAALLEGGRSFVDVSALEALALADDHTLAVYAVTGAVRRRYYSRVLIAYPMDLLPCKDGSIAFVPGHGDFATGVSELIERPELASHPVFESPRERVLRWREFDAFVRPWLDAHTADEVLERARRLRLAFGPVLEARELLADAHLEERGFFQTPSGGERTIGPPFQLSATPLRVGAPPGIGEHDAAPWSAPREEGEQSRAGSSFFEGLRVIDLSHVWAGPQVGRTLADLGADVVKVERSDPPETIRGGFVAGNDTSGEYWNRSPYFLARHAGKRAIALDLASEHGQELLHRLLEDADVLIENFTPRVLRKFGLDYGSLRERYPRLVMVSVCGFGQYGPRANDPALGQTIEPASGISVVTGYLGQPPIKAGNTLGDALSGMHGAAGVLAALRARERSGRGQHIDVSMQEVLLQLTAPQIMDALLNGRVHATAGNRRPGQVRGTYRCRGDDDWVAVSARDDREWAALCGAIGRADLASEERFANAAARDAAHDEIDELLAEWASGATKFEVMAALQGAGVPAGAVLHADEIFANEQLAARRFFSPTEIPEFGEIPLQRFVPALFDGEGYDARGRAPLVGEHTAAVLTAAGVSEEEQTALRAAGVTEPNLSIFQPEAVRKARTMALNDYLEQGSLLRIDADYRTRLEAVLGR